MRSPSFFSWALFSSLTLFACAQKEGTPLSRPTIGDAPNPRLEFWKQGPIGTNGFNDPFPDNEHAFSDEWFEAVASHEIAFVRLTTSKLIPSAGYTDFLIGSVNGYTGIPPADLALLKEILDRAERHGVKVWFVPLSLPGARWRQQNGGRWDYRIWQDPLWQREALAFWQDLAKEIKDHPALVAYSFLSEPAPEFTPQLPSTSPAKPVDPKTLDQDLALWYERAEGSLEDLNQFYEKMIEALREVDPQTPLILESGLGANVRALPFLKVQKDPAVLYAFHQYEPLSYTKLQKKTKLNMTNSLKSAIDMFEKKKD